MIRGFGTNYTVNPVVNGKRVTCPYYQCWVSMIHRCYSKSFLKLNANYQGCTIVDEWSLFSNFKEWMVKQDWKGKALDKDLLVIGNKVYGPETCMFVDQRVNSFLTGSHSVSKGVSLTTCNKYMARCCDLTGDNEYLGVFESETSAKNAYLLRKSEHCKTLSEQFTCIKVKEALLRWKSKFESEVVYGN